VKRKLLHRSRGSVLLARTGKTQEELAARLGVSRSLVGHWLTGHRVPTKLEVRTALRKAFAIPVEAWDEPAESALATQDTTTTWTADSVQARAQRLQSMIDAMTDQLQQSATPAEFSKFCRSITPALTHLGRLTGETLSIDESRIVRLPAWRRIEEALVRALAPWPDAMRAAGEELRRLAGER
jgi:transcriptional regulator with XRE-family HTH domain